MRARMSCGEELWGRAVGNFSELDFLFVLCLCKHFFFSFCLCSCTFGLLCMNYCLLFLYRNFFGTPPPFTRAMYTLPLEKLLTLEATDLVYPNEFSYFFCNF